MKQLNDVLDSYVNKNFDKAMNMVIKQANNLKGQLAKHPIKRNVNKLKAVQKLYSKFIAPALVKKDRRLDRDFDFTDIKKDLGNGEVYTLTQDKMAKPQDFWKYMMEKRYA